MEIAPFFIFKLVESEPKNVKIQELLKRKIWFYFVDKIFV